MNTFANAVVNQVARTENGMKARASTASACVDLFYAIGASRGKNIIPQFVAAYVENREVALRIALWARDVRGGAGERQLFRNILKYLENVNPDDAINLMYKTPLVGRWDDLLSFTGDILQNEAYNFITSALAKGDKLCAKWMPRKGPIAVALRSYIGLSPKEYRKTLVNLTSVVETPMCAKDWDSINFNHIPSLAAARYRTAFTRNTKKYAEYVAALTKGDTTAKVNVGAVYPYDVLKSVLGTYRGDRLSSTELEFINAQWNALPNLVGDNKVLPMIDVSGSMTCSAGGSKSLSCMDVAVSLGLYCASKNTGTFQDVFLTFSEAPQLTRVGGNIIQKLQQIEHANWGMNTNLHAAIDSILQVAINANVPQEQMPSMLVIFSDMQFDRCTRFDDSAMQMMQRKYEASGYEMPKIVFWNLSAHSNVPVKSTESGVALVSGFSPSLMTSLLSGNLEEFTPEAIMLKTVMVERYDF